jgi:hypothetical protein
MPDEILHNSNTHSRISGISDGWSFFLFSLLAYYELAWFKRKQKMVRLHECKQSFVLKLREEGDPILIVLLSQCALRSKEARLDFAQEIYCSHFCTTGCVAVEMPPLRLRDVQAVTIDHNVGKTKSKISLNHPLAIHFSHPIVIGSCPVAVPPPHFVTWAVLRQRKVKRQWCVLRRGSAPSSTLHTARQLEWGDWAGEEDTQLVRQNVPDVRLCVVVE